MIRLRDALKGMTNKERIDYLWEYYRLHFLFILVGLLFLYLIVNWLFFTEGTQLGLYVVSDSSMEDINEMTEQIEDFESDDYAVMFDHSFYEGEFDETQQSQFYERFTIRLAVGQIDAIVSNESFAEHLLDQSVFIPLTDVLDDEVLVSNEHDTLEVDNEIYGISTESMAIFNQSEALSDSYLFIPASGKNKEETADFIYSMIEK